MTLPRHTVYIIQSDRQPERFYTGLTSDLTARLAAHNAGLSTHTATGIPWRLVVAMMFTDVDNKAQAFEGYLKSGSGRAFAARHFR
ncbi:MAG: GIY-YIG nuclease family protein [Acidobacteriota bacterium]|nr:GIY-YIG nuclease family protein [Acidobacteriota bacterium]